MTRFACGQLPSLLAQKTDLQQTLARPKAPQQHEHACREADDRRADAAAVKAMASGSQYSTMGAISHLSVTISRCYPTLSSKILLQSLTATIGPKPEWQPLVLAHPQLR